MQRCDWVGKEAIYEKYHDKEWGVPIYNDRKLFEMLILEGAQAGLSWITILKKRAAYRVAFDRFDPHKIAQYGEQEIDALLENPGIVRNRLKVQATVQNARSFLELKNKGRTFSDFIWGFVDGEPKVNRWKSLSQVPTSTAVSDSMAKELKKNGFKFVGSTICYAYMQSVGLVNDHTTGCFRRREIIEGY